MSCAVHAHVSSTSERPGTIVPDTAPPSWVTSATWQVATALLVWAFVVGLQWTNDGLWFQGDSPRHATNGVFWGDFLARLPVDPLAFAVSYYARYPAINPASWPPAFYLLEAAAFKLLGISPFVAKGLVLAFTLAATLYLVAWLRRWVAPAAGWGALLFTLQPGTITWSHAVMLNVPATVLGIAALYHWRRWLESTAPVQLYAAAVAGTLAVLTYVPLGIVFVVMVAWAVAEGQTLALFRPRALIAGAITALPLAAWGVVVLKGTRVQQDAAAGLGGPGLTTAAAWTQYLRELPALVTAPVLAGAVAALILAVIPGRRRREIRLLLLWFTVTYLAYSAIAIKESRYILPLLAPLICLAVTAFVALVERAMTGAAAGRLGRPLWPVAAGLAGVVALHAGMARATPVPRTDGFREIVAFLQQTGAPRPIFYDGLYNGVFSFYLRAADPGLQWRVVLGHKLLYATRIEVRFGGTFERVTSHADVVRRLQHECACPLLVVERQVTSTLPGVRAPHLLRAALAQGPFRLIRSFPVHADEVTHVDVYDNIVRGGANDPVHLPFPSLGTGQAFDAIPIERDKETQP